MYRYGAPGVAVDFSKAQRWYCEAAEMGDWEGMEALANVLELLGKKGEAERWRKRLACEKSQSC